jgi:hypothetical protein
MRLAQEMPNVRPSILTRERAMRISKLVAATLFVSLLAASAANAAAIYTNGNTIIYPNGFILISNGAQLSDSFVPTFTGQLTSVQAGIWTNFADPLSSVGWSIGTSFFGSDIGSGVATTTDNYDQSVGAYEADLDTFALPNLFVSSGMTYYLTLYNAVTSGHNSVYWAASNGSSLAELNFQTLNGVSEPSEVFTLFANPVTAIPEPISLSIFGAGLIGACALRMRGKRGPALA